MARLREKPFGLAAVRTGGLQVAAPRTEAERSKVRREASPWRAWYTTARWQRLRWDVISASLFTCATCGRVEGKTKQLVADHITPHRGNEALFWDRANLQCLCKACHDTIKQREERAGIA